MSNLRFEIPLPMVAVRQDRQDRKPPTTNSNPPGTKASRHW